jgi:hypothetical protein
MSGVNGAEDFPLETTVTKLHLAIIKLHTLCIWSIGQLGITPENVFFKIPLLLSRWACLQREINLALWGSMNKETYLISVFFVRHVRRKLG